VATVPTTPNRTRWVLTIVVVLLVALLAVLVALFVNLLRPVGLPTAAPIAKADTMEWVRSLYGYGPSAAEQMKSPSSVAVGPNGDIYVTDPTRSRVLVFSADGTPKGMLKSETPSIHTGSFVRPEAIDVAENGDIFIADSQAKKVIVFNRNKEFVREYPVDQMARGVYVADSKVYVLDVGKVIVFDLEGKRISEFGTRGKAPGQIDAYQGIVAKDGTIFIADSYNKRIQAFDESGTLVWARPGTETTATGGDSGWDLPQDLTFNGRGELVVVDAFAFDLTVVDPKTGSRLKSYGTFGRADGEFFYPTSVAYDARRDWFVVADTQNNRVQVVRMPDSSAQPVQASLWRILSSPYRYLGPPACVLLLAIVFAAWSAWSMLKGHRSAE
jgi:sugar lactone lactonase YvrE